MSDWIEASLGDLAQWYSGGTPNTSTEEYWGGDIPWISAASLHDFHIASSGRCVTPIGAANGTRLVPAGTTIFVVRGMSLMTEFRIGVTQREVAFGQDCKALVPKPAVDPYFLAYAIRAQTSAILGMVDMAGHGTGRLQTDRIASLRIPLPTNLEEQQFTVAVLKALDDKVAVNGKIAVAGKALAIALSCDEQQVMAIPLKELVTHVRDQVLPETIAAERVAHYSIPAFDSMQLPEMVPPGSIKSSKFIVSAPSVLVSKLNPSTPRVWNVDPPPRVSALASTEFLVLKPSQGITTDELWAVCGQPSFTVSLEGKVTGTSNSHQRVKPADLLATEVVDPRTLPPEVRESISALARRVQQARIESQSLASLRDALLPKLMSGEIRVRDAERIVESAT